MIFYPQVQDESQCCYSFHKRASYAKLQTELRHFCEKTSVKGVKRTVDKTRILARRLWIVVIIVCLFPSLSNTSYLIRSYLKFLSVTYIEERIVTVRKDPDQNTVPAVTVCNTQPLSKRRSPDVMSFSQYANFIERSIQNMSNASLESSAFLNEHKSELISPAGYYQFIGTDNASKVGHSFHDLVVLCEVVVAQSTKTILRPCSELANISLNNDPNFFNCYTIQPADQTAHHVVIGYSLMLYLDADYSWITSPYITNPMKFSKGAVFTMHQPNTKPFVTFHGTSVSPGTLTISKVSLKKHHRLPAPYENCIKASQSRFIQQDGSPMRYTALSCCNACVEDRVAQKCHCRDGTLPAILWYELAHLPFCGDAHADLDVLLQRLNCAHRVRKMDTVSCHQSCDDPCNEATYDATASHMEWPDASDVNYFYDTYIKGAPVEELFGTIHELTGGDCERLNQSCSHFDHVTEKIKSSFVVIRSHLFNHRYITIGSAPAITSTSLISEIGGALNLWSGISLVVIVEVLEVVLRLIFPAPSCNTASSSVVHNPTWTTKYAYG